MNILSTEAVEGMLIDLKVKGNAERLVQVGIILVLVTMVIFIFRTWQFPLTSGCLKSCGPILLNQHVTFPRDQRNTCPQVELRNVFLGPTTCLH